MVAGASGTDELCAGCLACVVRAYPCNAASDPNIAGVYREKGYLAVAVGELVQVLYVGTQDDERGWVYGRLDGAIQDCYRDGWLPTDALRTDPPDARSGSEEPLAPLDSPVQPHPPDAARTPVASTGAECGVWKIHRRSDRAVGTWLRDRAEAAPKDTTSANGRLVENGQYVWQTFSASGFALVRTRCGAEGWLQERYLHPIDGGHASPRGRAEPEAPHRPAPARPCPGPAVPRKSVRAYTVGLDNYDQKLVDVCQDCDRGAQGAFIDEDVMQEVFHRRGLGRVDIVNDVRMFSDPQSCQYNYHIGVNPAIMEFMAKSRNFPTWVERLRKSVAGVLDRAPTVRIVFFCKSGKHRSVAAARFLQHFAECEGWSWEGEHLCRDKWKGTCKGNCEECREPSEKGEQRQRTLQQAHRYWKLADRP